jgi:hypothetical protein
MSDQELLNAKAFLTDAWWLLTTRLPALETAMLSSDPLVFVSADNVRRVVTNMVLRMLRNPEGFVTESIDDYSYRRATAIASGALSILPDELVELTPGGRRRVRSIRLVAHGE